MAFRSTREQEKEFTEAVIPNALEAAVEWIGDQLAPEEVFDESRLHAWAEDNGYTKED
jgi:hypothetical protein